MILSPVRPLGDEEQQEAMRLEARVNAAIREYHNQGKDPVIHVPATMTDGTRQSLNRAVRVEGWRITAERGEDALGGSWETWTLTPQRPVVCH
jgi:hypothetical protein